MFLDEQLLAAAQSGDAAAAAAALDGGASLECKDADYCQTPQATCDSDSDSSHARALPQAGELLV